MQPILIVTHVDHEGPGYFAQVLERNAIPYRVVSIGRGDALPEHPNDYSGLVFMGGPMSVNDPLPWIQQELRLIRNAVDAAIPVLGHCLGGQLISKALGGIVTRNRVREIGWFDVEQTSPRTAPEWFADLPASFSVFHWHGETFSLPNGATSLLRNQNCEQQAFVVGNTLALQCHIEMTEAMVQQWVASAPEEFTHPSGAVQNSAEITHDLKARVAELHRIADIIYTRWLHAAHK
jgi:GMP synthase-like glutamine amidotransferase